MQRTGAARVVQADSEPIEALYIPGPGAALSPPSGLRGSIGWPLRARAVDEEPKQLSGARVEIDSTRTASRLVCVFGGNLYASASNGALRTRTTDIDLTGAAPGGADLAFALRLANDTLSPEYAAAEIAGGERRWTIEGGDRSTTARARTEISLAQSYWLAPLSDIAGRRLPSSALAVRIEGQVGAPARSTLRVRAVQLVPRPDGNGKWVADTDGSRNPAAVLRAFAIGWYDAAGRLTAGTGRDPDTIDDDVLARFYRHCEDHDPPLRCDLALQDDNRSAEQVERLIAATGRAQISWATGRLGVAWAGPDDAPQGLIGPANVLPGSFAVAWRDGPAPDEIVASYLDRAVWDAREVRIPVPGGTVPPVRERQIQIEGVTEAAAARFHAAAAAGEEAYHRRAISWRAGKEGAQLVPASLWWMAADLLSGGLTGRLRALGVRNVRLDRPVMPGANPWIAIDLPGGGLHRTRAFRADNDPAGGQTDALILVEPIQALPAADASSPRDAIWRLYDEDKPPKPVRIVSNRPLSEDAFEIVARDESAAFWAFLDDYRDEPAPPSVALPQHVEIAADGAWNWPQAWTDAGIVSASLVLRGAGGGRQGSATYDPGDPGANPKDDIGPSCSNGSPGGNGAVSRATLADGTVLTARGGAGGGRSFFGHNALGEPGGSARFHSVRLGCTGGRGGQPRRARFGGCPKRRHANPDRPRKRRSGRRLRRPRADLPAAAVMPGRVR